MKFNEVEFGLKKESHSLDSSPRYVELEISTTESPPQSDNLEVSQADTEAEPGEEEVDGDHALEEPALRRSNRVRHRPDYLIERVSLAEEEPSTVKEALDSHQCEKWKEAMAAEMQSLQDNSVWELVDLPKERKPLGCKWVFKVKTNEEGEVERYKARLVAQGFSQVKGADYDETFCPVVCHESLRMLIATAVQRGLQLHQMDVTTAFLNGVLEEEILMRQPEGFVVKGLEHMVCRLKHSIYGLKQSPRCWNSVLDEYLKQFGFVKLTSDPCIYTMACGEMIVGVYVDDIIIAGKNEKQVKVFKTSVGEKFDVKDLGRLHYFLGMKIVQSIITGDVWMGQPTYVGKVLERFGMNDAKAVATPIDASSKLTKGEDGEERIDQGIYQSAVGSLLYLSTGTRVDITFAVSYVARFSSDPTKRHWIAVKRILRYLKGTADLGLLYTSSGEQTCFGYSDSDWAGDVEDRRSTSGYIFKFSGAGISWKSKKQISVALSTAEAEYIALSSSVQEVIWLRHLVSELSNDKLACATMCGSATSYAPHCARSTGRRTLSCTGHGYICRVALWTPRNNRQARDIVTCNM